MKKLLLGFTVVLGSTVAQGQQQGNIWFFGNQAGVDFNSGIPIAISGGQTYLGTGHNEGTSSISDSSGALLFYTNGEKAWNNNHQIMPNGDSLLGHYSSTQSSLIVPRPGSDNIFYLFTTDSWHINNLKNGFRYSKIDMCLDNKLGDVIINEKNVLLLGTVSEKLTVVKHFNNVDYWIITHKYYSDKFYSYKLTSNGITDSVISSIGSIHANNCNPPSNSTSVAIGQMKASPNGTKLALATLNNCDNLKELFDFDRSTGIVSNFINLELQMDTFGGYGVSFSPDNTKLYISSNSPGKIYQYNLTAGGGNPDSIRNSKIKVVDIPSVILGLQLGPDGKIYVARGNYLFLAVINNPNASGFACNFSDNAVSLTGESSYGMPNFIDSYNYHNNIPKCEEGIMDNESYRKFLKVYPNPFSTHTTLRSDIPFHNATLSVYNCFGQEVKQINNISGQSITFNRGNLPSGVYFAHIMQGDKTISADKPAYTGKLIITDK